MYVLRHGAFGIDLDEEIQITFFIFVANRGVRSDDRFFSARGLEFRDYRSCSSISILRCSSAFSLVLLTSNGQPRDLILFWQFKAKFACVIIVLFNLRQLQVNEALVAARERIGASFRRFFLGLSRGIRMRLVAQI